MWFSVSIIFCIERLYIIVCDYNVIDANSFLLLSNCEKLWHGNEFQASTSNRLACRACVGSVSVLSRCHIAGSSLFAKLQTTNNQKYSRQRCPGRCPVNSTMGQLWETLPRTQMPSASIYKYSTGKYQNAERSALADVPVGRGAGGGLGGRGELRRGRCHVRPGRGRPVRLLSALPALRICRPRRSGCHKNYLTALWVIIWQK